MAGRSRRFSSTSVEEDEGHRRSIRHITEADALKPIGKNVYLDDYPCFVLEDAVIYLKDKKTIGNLLNTELRGACVIRGRLVVEDELRSRRKYPDHLIQLVS